MKIGLLVGMEESFPRAFLERAARHEDVQAELIRIGTLSRDATSPYDVIVDRASHEVDFYRPFVFNAALGGTRVINDPILGGFRDRFTSLAVAARLGFMVPKSLLLPQKDYPPTVTSGSLRNLEYPLDWDAILRVVGTPAWLRMVSGDNPPAATRVHTVEELLSAYDRTGTDVVMLQEEVKGDRNLRCIVVGGDRVIVARFDPEYRTVHFDPDYLGVDLEARVVRDASGISRALGLAINAVEYVVRDGVPWLVDVECVPDLELSALTPYYFEPAVDAVVEYCLRLGREGTRPAVTSSLFPQAKAAGPLVAHLSEVSSASRLMEADTGGSPRRSDARPPKPARNPAGSAARSRRGPGSGRAREAGE